MEKLRRMWTRFRGWPLWAQLGAGVAAAIVVVALFASGDDGADVASSPTTTTTRPTTTSGPATAPATTPTTTPSRTTVTLPSGAPAVGGDAAVRTIRDGDTFQIASGEAIGLIGVDSPDTDACFGAEAAAHLAELIPVGTPIRLTYDVERRDRFHRFQRTVAYVYRASDGLFVNAAMARDGFAVQLTVPPNLTKADELGAAVAEARAADRGLWGACQTAAGESGPPTT